MDSRRNPLTTTYPVILSIEESSRVDHRSETSVRRTRSILSFFLILKHDPFLASCSFDW
jgi:hypothetical protein